MTQPQNDPAAQLQNLKVPACLPAAQQLKDYLISEFAAKRIPNTDDLLRNLVASHLQVVQYIGQLEESFAQIGQMNPGGGDAGRASRAHADASISDRLMR